MEQLVRRKDGSPAAGSGKKRTRLLDRVANSRIAIEGVAPEIGGGRFAVKRVEGEELAVEADIFCDGHDVIAAAVLVRDAQWRGVRNADAPPRQ